VKPILTTQPTAKIRKPRRTHLLEGDLALAEVTPESRRQAACVLEVLAGLRTPEQAALALGLTLQTYYNVETRALRGLIHGCTPTPPGRTMVLLKQVRGLETRCAELQKQLGRYQALLRNAQRSAGLITAPAQPAGKTPKGKRKRRPTVRALRCIELLGRGGAASPGSGQAATERSGAAAACAEPVASAAGSSPADQAPVTCQR
jgi:hypothetical protein